MIKYDQSIIENFLVFLFRQCFLNQILIECGKVEVYNLNNYITEMGCDASEISKAEPALIEGEARDNEENIVCQICNVCFNTKERAPLIICPSNHSVCKTCADSFSKKNLNRCPFCRVELNFACLTSNERLMIKLGKYQSEEKGFVRKNPSFMSQQQLLR